MELSHGGLQPWVNRGSLMIVRGKSARLKSIVDTGKTCDCIVGGGFSGDLPTMVDY